MRVLVDERLPRHLQLQAGGKAVMDMARAQDWTTTRLVEVIVEQGITRHVFLP